MRKKGRHEIDAFSHKFSKTEEFWGQGGERSKRHHITEKASVPTLNDVRCCDSAFRCGRATATFTSTWDCWLLRTRADSGGQMYHLRRWHAYGHGQGDCHIHHRGS